MENLQKLSDEILHDDTQNIAQRERELTITMLHHLREIERRSLFAKLGYPSLFEYCTCELKYSGGAAQRRISAMRLLKSVPELEQKIEQGDLSLSVLSQAQTFFKNEEIKNPEDKREVLHALEGLSSREAERELVSRSEHPERLVPEKLRAVSANLTEIKILVDNEFLKDLDGLKALLARGEPGISVKEVIERAVRNELKRAQKRVGGSSLPPWKLKSKKSAGTGDKKQPSADSLPTSEVKPNKPTRYIPARVKREVWRRDHGRCTYTHPETGRCGSTYGLQVDHIQPFAAGGESTLENLRLLCPAHNQLAAAQHFGARHMANFISRMQ
jgi:hypothetical protein